MKELSAVLRHMTQTSTELTDLMSGDDVDRAAVALIQRVLAADEILWTHIDLQDTSAIVRGGADLTGLTALADDLARTAQDHPAVVSYLTPGDDRRPRRISDIADTSSWTNSSAYVDAFSKRGGRFQLSLVTHLTGTTGTGWVLTRSLKDFTASDVEAATLLLPFLTALTALARSLPEVACSPPQEPLTARERAVLGLLAQGLSATSIGRQLGIAEGTVRKHLNHVYTKLGVHDRLGAVLVGAIDGAHPSLAEGDAVHPVRGQRITEGNRPVSPGGR